jgi:hypothetical protein
MGYGHDKNFLGKNLKNHGKPKDVEQSPAIGFRIGESFQLGKTSGSDFDSLQRLFQII